MASSLIRSLAVTAAATNNPAFTPLLDAVEQVLGSLIGVLFVADAMHAQTGHAREIATRGAHFAVQVKANQPTLFAQLKPCPGPTSRPETAPATAATAGERPAPSRPSPCTPPAASDSRTPSKPSGSLVPART